MVIAALVIIYYALLDTFGSNFYSNMDNPVLASVCRQDPKLYGIERISRISARHIRQEVQSVLIDLCMEAAHAFLRVFHRPFQKDLYIFLFQRFQLKDAGSGDQRAVYFKIRVLRSPAPVALICLNSALVVLAITLASVVFPVPGGP